MIARVVSKKQPNTAVVLVSNTKTDKLYKKSFSRTKRYTVLDLLEVKLGDLVEIVKIKPVSKTKHWKIVKVVGQDLKEVIGDKLMKEAAQTISEVMPEEKENDKGEKSDEKSEEKEKK